VYGSVDGWYSPHIYIHFKSPLLHKGCTLLFTNYMNCFFIKVENLKPSPNLAYKWFYGMLIHYTLQKIAKQHKKWTTQSCIHLVHGHYDPLILGLLLLTTTIVDYDFINSTFACFSLDLCFVRSTRIPSSIIIIFCFPSLSLRFIPSFPIHFPLQLSSFVKQPNIHPRWPHEINYNQLMAPSPWFSL